MKVKVIFNNENERYKIYNGDTVINANELTINEIPIDSELSDTSANAVENKVVKEALDSNRAEAIENINLLATRLDSIINKGSSVIAGTDFSWDWDDATTGRIGYSNNFKLAPNTVVFLAIPEKSYCRVLLNGSVIYDFGDDSESSTETQLGVFVTDSNITDTDNFSLLMQVTSGSDYMDIRALVEANTTLVKIDYPEELKDIRTDYYGFTYASAGDAVRSIMGAIVNGEIHIEDLIEWTQQTGRYLGSASATVTLPVNTELKISIPDETEIIIGTDTLGDITATKPQELTYTVTESTNIISVNSNSLTYNNLINAIELYFNLTIDGLVPVTRAIANITLENDITAIELLDALRNKTKTVSGMGADGDLVDCKNYSQLTVTTVAEIGHTNNIIFYDSDGTTELYSEIITQKTYNDISAYSYFRVTGSSFPYTMQDKSVVFKREVLELINNTNTIDTEMSDESENAVENKVIKSYVDNGDNFLKNAIDNGEYNIIFNGNYAKSTDGRIVYLNNGNTFNEFITLYCKDGYDITTTTTYGSAGSWRKRIDVLSGDYVAIRRSDKSYFGNDYATELQNVVSYKKISDSKKNKYTHFSFDDCDFWIDFITNADIYTSIFDNSFLADLKELHDDYGAVFTLNCFCRSLNHIITEVPEKKTFQSEFINNSDWLRFAFHAKDSSTRYDTDAVTDITDSYNEFISGIFKLTGSTDCIDRVTRLGFFTGTLNNVKAIRDCNCGILGLLTADDNRVSYYLDTDQNNYILGHSKYLDSDNQITLIKSQVRLESVSNVATWAETYKTVAKSNFKDYLEFFTHEYEWNSTMKEKAEILLQWCKANNYGFVFMQDILKL